MISEFKDTKFYFESMFQSFWTTTPIHYMYQEFKAPKDSWINVVYQPLRLGSGSLSRTTGDVDSNLSIVCWANNDVEVLTLVDDIITFLEDNNEHDLYHIGDMQVIDQGVDDSNKAFIYLSFAVSNKVGACGQLPPTVITRILTYHGKTVTHNGIMLTH